ncbi:MAG: hypothetical protein PHI63_02470 [Patescibacteria group bacterium]|nr:hypothetical protein [Patescibacteria group bacterium]
MFRMFLTSFAAFLVVSFLGASTVQSADPPPVVWEKQSDGGRYEAVSDLQSLPDGGFVAVGYRVIFGLDNTEDVTLLRMDAEGHMIWRKEYDRSVIDMGTAVAVTTDGGFILAGGSVNNWPPPDDPPIPDDFHMAFDILLVKTEADGNSQWRKALATPGRTSPFSSVCQVADGGYVAATFLPVVNAGMDGYLVKTDADGNLQWARTYGGSQDDYFSGIQPTDDGGCVVVGITQSSGAGGEDIFVVKIDANGDATTPNGWQKTFGGAGSDQGGDFCRAANGGYYIVGESNSFGGVDADVYVLKIDVAGTLQWQRTYPGTDRETGLTVNSTSDGGAVVVTHAIDVTTHGLLCSSIIRLEQNGDIRWQKSYDAAAPPFAVPLDVVQLSDGGYGLAGHKVVSWEPAELDVYVAKLASDGPPRPPAPENFSAVYSAADQHVTLAWTSSPAAVGYVIQRKVGCGNWEPLHSLIGDITTYEDRSPPKGNAVSYRLYSVSDLGPSRWTDPQCITVPSEQRWQLKLYDPDAPNPFSEKAGAWVDFYPCDPRFKEDRGTAVIVHGWNTHHLTSSNQDAWTLEVASAITTTQRLTSPVNVLIWEWLPEAEAVYPTDAIKHIDGQASYLATALSKTFGDGYTGPVHLMGHSLGTHVVIVCAMNLFGLLGGKQMIAVNPQQIQLTLWDTPDVADDVLGCQNYLDRNVGVLRGLGVYVDSYHGFTNIGTHFANLWVNVPGVSHGVFEWYLSTIPINTNPSLYQAACSDEVFPGTVGFGTSELLADTKSRPESPPGPCRDVGTLMFSPVRCMFRKPFVFLGAENCQIVVPVQAATSNVTIGNYRIREDWQPNNGFVNSTEMYLGALPSGGGGSLGVGGEDEIPPDVLYTLDFTILPEWDYLSFEYDFTEAPASTTLTAVLTTADSEYPIFEMTSDLVLNEGYLDTGLRDIRSLHGQAVTITFELRSAQPGMVVYLRNLTFWEDPWNGNTPPIANAGPDQTTMANAGGTAVVTLDGSATMDPDGDLLTYWWMVDGELLADGVNPAVELPVGTHPITLLVRDPAENVGTDDVVVTLLPFQDTFIRGDTNGDGVIDISDVLRTLFGMYMGWELTCQDAADFDDNGIVQLADVISTLTFLFRDGDKPSEPFSNRGSDPTSDALGCDSY